MLPVRNHVNSIESLFNAIAGDLALPDREVNVPRVDIVEKEDKFVLKAEMPGFKNEDINVTFENDLLTIEAEKKEEKTDDKKHISEIVYGKVKRVFQFEGVSDEGISATYGKNGILTIELPKVKENVKRIEVK